MSFYFEKSQKKCFFVKVTQRPWQGLALRKVFSKKSFFQNLALDQRILRQSLGHFACFLWALQEWTSERANEKIHRFLRKNELAELLRDWLKEYEMYKSSLNYYKSFCLTNQTNRDWNILIFYITFKIKVDFLDLVIWYFLRKIFLKHWKKFVFIIS